MTCEIENNRQGVVCKVLTTSWTFPLAGTLLNQIQNGAAGDRLIGINWAHMPTTIWKHTSTSNGSPRNKTQCMNQFD